MSKLQEVRDSIIKTLVDNWTSTECQLVLPNLTSELNRNYLQIIIDYGYDISNECNDISEGTIIGMGYFEQNKGDAIYMESLEILSRISDGNFDNFWTKKMQIDPPTQNELFFRVNFYINFVY